MAVVVSARGFEQEDRTFLPFEDLWNGQDLPDDSLPEGDLAVDFPNDRDPVDLAPWLGRLQLVRVRFPAMGDGRGFSIGARLRTMGYTGRLRAAGPLIVDQFAAARRMGFDEVELPEDRAARLPADPWPTVLRPSYRDRLLG